MMVMDLIYGLQIQILQLIMMVVELGIMVMMDFSGMNEGLGVYTNCWAFYNGQLEGEGNGFKLGWVETSSSNLRRVMTNCLAVYNGAKGIVTNEDLTTIVQQCIFIIILLYGNGWRGSYFGIEIYDTGASNTTELLRVFRNNICALNANDDVYLSSGAVYTHSNNTWDGGVTTTAGDFKALPSSRTNALAILSVSRQSDGSLPDIGDYFKLAAGSDLIDAGMDVGLTFSGNAPDLGFSEYTSGSVTIPIPTFVSAVVENATPSRLDMTYNLTLANIVPATSAFTVMVNTSARSVSAVAISGTKVMLTLASPVVYGDVVTVAYTKPASNPLQTVAGGQAASLTAKNVTNNVAAVNPSVC